MGSLFCGVEGVHERQVHRQIITEEAQAIGGDDGGRCLNSIIGGFDGVEDFANDLHGVPGFPGDASRQEKRGALSCLKITTLNVAIDGLEAGGAV